MRRSGTLSRLLLISASIVAAALMLGACSSDSSSDPDQSQSPTEQSETSLAIVVDDNGKVHEWTLTCNPDGGTHPDPQGGCAFLDLAIQWGQDPFAPVPDDQVCAQIYGGPQTATIKGSWDGKSVDAQFSRVNSCEIERWSNAIRILVIEGGA